MMEVRLLGQFEATECGVSVLPTASKPRQVLALLALNPGKIVTVGALMEELWGDDIPRSASTTLQTYIMQLRRKLRSALATEPRRTAKDVLVTHPTGYLLQVLPHNVDAFAHEELLAAGQRCVAAGDDAAAARLLAEALRLWRGPALIDVPVGPRLELEVMRLHSQRMYALELRIEADLRLGRHQSLLSELALLTAQQPLNENLHAAYMIALCHSGRQVQALSVYQRLRHTLTTELGIEPCARVQEIQHAILSAAPMPVGTRPAPGMRATDSLTVSGLNKR